MFSSPAHRLSVKLWQPPRSKGEGLHATATLRTPNCYAFSLSRTGVASFDHVFYAKSQRICRSIFDLKVKEVKSVRAYKVDPSYCL